MYRPRKITFIILLIITVIVGCDKQVNRPEVPAPSDTTCVDPDEDDKD
jgi:hypothetical protein